jgi:hypothetical protein
MILSNPNLLNVPVTKSQKDMVVGVSSMRKQVLKDSTDSFHEVRSLGAQEFGRSGVWEVRSVGGQEFERSGVQVQITTQTGVIVKPRDHLVGKGDTECKVLNPWGCSGVNNQEPAIVGGQAAANAF